MSAVQTGILYGVGVGPGDPELMTLKAHRLIAGALIVAYPAPVGGHSLAREIAAASIGADVREIVVDLPMTKARGPAQAAYDRGALAIAACLQEGEDVVMLCEGDPLFYGSFMYIHARLKDRFTCEIIPGVSSVMASAAAFGQSIVARNEVLTVIPAPLEPVELRRRIEAADAVVLMKVGRHMSKIRVVLDDLGLTESAVYIERATLPEQRKMGLADAPADAPYFSMILVSKGADPWL